MRTIGGRGLHGQVVNAVGTRIMRGELPPGSALDPEQLAQEFGVSRTVVREVLKVLTAKGLVGARPKLGTHVAERANWQLLDADVMEWRTSGAPDPRLVVELAEVRLVIEPSAARLAAQRRTDGQLDRIRVACEHLERAYGAEPSGRPDHTDADLEFHRAVLAASGNELLESFAVVLAPALQARDRLAHRHMTSMDFLGGHRRVLEAITATDSEAAFEAMRALMELSATSSAAALERPARED